ncbi:efflux RND transporter permease subunit [bacterium]|nr:efflux RND transporter permease subunit [bacterium]
MLDRFSRATQWIVTRPWLTVLVLAAITTLACIGHSSPQLVTDLFADDRNDLPANILQPQRKKATQTKQERPEVESFAFGGEAILVAQSDNFFTPSGATAIQDVVATLKATDYIRSVIWMEDVPPLNLFGLPEPTFPKSSASPALFDKAKQKAQANPFINGQLLSADAKTMLLMFNYDFLFIEDDRQCIEGVIEIADAVVAKHENVDIEFGITGRLPIYLNLMKQSADNTFFYQLVGYSVIFVMSVILFRGLVSVMVLGIAPALGVFWTLGFVNFLGFENNPFIDVILPVLVSLVGLTDGVHLMVQIRKLRSEGLPPLDAARDGLAQVGLACALTSLTTAIGFCSLALARHEFVQQFGYSCVIGVTCTFVSVITVIPLACSTWIGKHITIGKKPGLVEQHLGRVSGVIDFVLPRKVFFSITAVITTLVLVGICLTLRPDERLSAALPANSQASRTLLKLDAAMEGLERGDIRIQWSAEVESDSPEVMQVVSKVDELLSKEPLIGHPVSIRNLVEAMPGDAPAEERMSMLDLLLPPFKRAFYEPEYRYAKVNFHVRDLGISKYDQPFTRIIEGLRKIEKQHPNFDLFTAGDAFYRWENVYKIVSDLALSLGTATLIIFCILSLVYRSLRIGLISFVPNLFPLSFAGLFLVLTGTPLEVVAVCAFTVCLGIAVDDTIHFLTRFEEERNAGYGKDEAIRRAFTGVGTALIMTTVVLVSGFATVLFSDSRDHFVFAAMGSITIGAALFADMVFLPALLSWFIKD